MLEFDDKFFEDEVRDGYFVRSEMKRRWAAEMEVLAEIDRVCKKTALPILPIGGHCWEPCGIMDLFHGMTIWIL